MLSRRRIISSPSCKYSNVENKKISISSQKTAKDNNRHCGAPKEIGLQEIGELSAPENEKRHRESKGQGQVSIL